MFDAMLRNCNWGRYWVHVLLLLVVSACGDDTTNHPSAPWSCYLASDKTEVCSCYPDKLDSSLGRIAESCAKSVSTDFLCCAYGVNGNNCDCFYSTGYAPADNDHCGPQVKKVPTCP